jgi:hypothetical protein
MIKRITVLVNDAQKRSCTKEIPESVSLKAVATVDQKNTAERVNNMLFFSFVIQS